jgi:hypothetical protein
MPKQSRRFTLIPFSKDGFAGAGMALMLVGLGFNIYLCFIGLALFLVSLYEPLFEQFARDEFKKLKGNRDDDTDQAGPQ